MRYSEMIAKEKQRAQRRGDLPGSVRDLHLPKSIWIFGALIALLVLTAS